MTYDCQRCGACCLSFDVLLTGVEVDRFESDARLAALTTLHPRAGAEALRFMKKLPGSERCVALDGTLGNCHCRIYAERPGLCREFAAGSEDCLAARRRFGLPASA